MKKGSGTRSGLLWEVERILDECDELPQILLMENVPQVIGAKNIKDFQSWRRKLEQLGYSNHVALLNGKEIGWPHPVPQNRNRCFMLSLLGDYHYTFPQKQKLTLRLKDVLEDTVDEKYYLSPETVKYMVANSERMKTEGNGFRFSAFERERESSEDRADQDGQIGSGICQRVGYIEHGTGEHQSNQVFSAEGTARTLQARDCSSPIKIIDVKKN